MASNRCLPRAFSVASIALTALSEAVSARPIPLIEAVLYPALEQARLALGEAAFAATLQEGRRMSRDELKAEVLAIDVGSPVDIPSVSTVTRVTTALPSGLTARELEVLRLLVSGATSAEIAEELAISIHTVERHITQIYQKIGARGRAEATAFALASGLT